ncbi:MAG: hypothetical protein ACP6IS_01205 [Candidatus Asgardarchaeia archaeon]
MKKREILSYLLLISFFGFFLTGEAIYGQPTYLYPTHYYQYPNFFVSRIAWAHGSIVLLSENAKELLFINPEDGALLERNITLQFLSDDLQIIDVFVEENTFYLLVKNSTIPEIVVTNSTGYPTHIISLVNISYAKYFTSFTMYGDSLYFVLNDYIHSVTGLLVYNFSLYQIANITFNVSDNSQYICDIEVVRDSLWILYESGLIKSMDFNNLKDIQEVTNVSHTIYKRVGSVDLKKYIGVIYSRTEIWVGITVYNSSNQLEYFLLVSFDFGSIENPILSYLPFTIVNYAVISFLFSIFLSLYSLYMIYYTIGAYSGSLLSLVHDLERLFVALKDLLNELKKWRSIWSEVKQVLKHNTTPSRFMNVVTSFNVISSVIILIYSLAVATLSSLYSFEIGVSFVIANTLSSISFAISLYFIIVIFSLSVHLIKELGLRFYIMKIFLLFLIPLITSVYVLYYIYSFYEFGILIVLLSLLSIILGRTNYLLYKALKTIKK